MDLSFEKYNSCDRCREGKLREPEILCYYHQKIKDGLIDEPENEFAYVEVWSDDPDFIDIFQEQLSYVVNHFCPMDLKGDASQYAGIGYRRLLASWDPAQASWRTFCFTAIRNRVKDFMKKEMLYGERFEIASDFVNRTLGVDPNPEDLVLEKERVDSLRMAIARAMSDITERQSVVLWARMVNHMPATQQDIADQWDTTRQSIIRDEESIIKILRKEIDYEIQNRYMR